MDNELVMLIYDKSGRELRHRIDHTRKRSKVEPSDVHISAIKKDQFCRTNEFSLTLNLCYGNSNENN